MIENRKRGGSKNFAENHIQPNKLYSNLDRNDLDYFQAAFHAMDYNKQGSIQFNEMITLLSQKYKIQNREKELIFKEFESKAIKLINQEAVLIIASILKEEKKKIEENSKTQHSNEYIDAFVALGGEHDQTGSVPRQKIVDIIMNEFELTFDMAQFLEKIEVQEENLDYKTFCQVFEQEERALSRAGSVLSVLSSKSKASNLKIGRNNKNQESLKTLKVKYRDFEKFEEEYLQKQQEKHYNQIQQQEEEEGFQMENNQQNPEKIY